MSFTVKGKIYRVGDTQQVSDKFSKREFIVETADNPKYTQYVKMEATGDRCALLDEVNVGDGVTIDVDLRGRLYTSKKTGEEDCFTSLTVWKLEVTSKAAQTGTSSGDQDSVPF